VVGVLRRHDTYIEKDGNLMTLVYLKREGQCAWKAGLAFMSIFTLSTRFPS
jgi:hypothetical protein